MSKDQTKKQVVVKVRKKDASKANVKPEAKTETKTAETQVKTKKDLNSLLGTCQENCVSFRNLELNICLSS